MEHVTNRNLSLDDVAKVAQHKHAVKWFIYFCAECVVTNESSPEQVNAPYVTEFTKGLTF